MKTALKLNKKQLFELYEKSNEKIKESLRAEFGEGFFEVESRTTPKPASIPTPFKTRTKNQFMNWEAIFDFTPMLRIAGYALLLGLILSI